MVPPGFTERTDPAPVKAGGRGGPLGLGAGDGGPAGREDAAGGAGTAGVEAPGTALDGTRGPGLCGGPTLVGAVFNGGTIG